MCLSVAEVKQYAFPANVTCLPAWTNAQAAWRMYSVYQKNHDVSHSAGVGEGRVCVHTCERDKDDQTVATDNMCATFPISMLLGGLQLFQW